MLSIGPLFSINAGIPLVSALAVSLSTKFKRNTAFCYNRKEKKDHGEGGIVVGPMHGTVVVIDDVITAGTAIRESVAIIRQQDCIFGGVLIALDRMERGQGDKSAIQEVETEFGVRVVSIVTMEHVVEYLEEVGGFEEVVGSIREYRKEYGTTA